MLLIREEFLNKKGKTNKELRIELACWLYDHGALSWGRAADFAGMDKYTFWGELDKRGSTILDDECIMEELKMRKQQ